ncbi:hypothetical protein F9U64_00075 [Gracilibacillus oryzae]|uniref:Uncharacterized protein n=1 Tax=Gracilibacillus oryzae TaxID=1672701 RepID=A0A7C8LA26_9BACI|nr:hypothetical protein [Gracilibacillus oryzae]KAB8139466.1 hypothetical protein F9U64_00075 [Gracilibacillus oryzae]
MDYEELKQRVAMGEEFQFYYRNQSFWISRNKNGYYLTRVRDSYSQSFKTSNELFVDGRIDGKSIQELWKEIEI